MNRADSLENYFKLCSYLLMGTGFVTLAVTGRVDFPSLILYAAALAFSWRSDRPGSKLQINAKTANLLALSFIPFVYFDFRFISQSYTGPLIHYSLFISIFNLFKIKADRDWVFLYLIAIFEVLLAATLTIDLTFIVLFSVFILTAIATLEAFEIKRSGGEVYKPKEERLLSKIGQALPLRRIGYLVGVTFAMVVLIAVIALPIFLLIPRFNSGFMAQSFGSSTVSITGFSDIVQLGEVGSIKKNDQVVMHVRVKNLVEGKKLSRSPKWRGVSLSLYDGRTWREPRRDQVVLRAVAGRYSLSNRSSEDPDIIEQQFYLEPLNTPVVFMANRALSLNDQLPVVYRNQADSISTLDHSIKQITYTAYSDLYLPNAASLRRDEALYNEEVKRRYLQLPILDERIGELAKEITRNAGSRYEKAIAIEQYLKKNYGYTLDLRRTNDSDPMADFLFNIKEGHCEYFASSMVVLLRSAGVAARIVNGFQSGEYNDVGNAFVVRQSDAHSWVEVYFPESDAWIEFDPTPPAGLSSYSLGFSMYLRKYLDAVRMLWLDYVVTYDSQRQSYLATAIQQAIYEYKLKLDGFRLDMREYMRTAYAGLTVAASTTKYRGSASVAVALIVAAGFLWRFRKLSLKWRIEPMSVYSSWLGRLFVIPWLRWRNRTDPQQSAVLFYNEMLAALGRWDIARKPDQTPLEFAAEANIAEVRLITDRYNRVRFSGNGLAVSEWGEVNELLARLRKWRPSPVAGRVARTASSASRRRALLRATAAALLISLPPAAFYFYNERLFKRTAAFAHRRIDRFESNYGLQSLVSEIASGVRTEKGNGAEELKEAFLSDSVKELMTSRAFSEVRWMQPWEEHFNSATLSDRSRILLARIVTRPEIQLAEKAASRSDFNIQSANLTETERAAMHQLDYDMGNNLANIMLWKAYILMISGNLKECERELALVVSLGERMSQDSSFNNVLVGYSILARSSHALSKYYKYVKKQSQATAWMSLSKNIHVKWTELTGLHDNIHIAASSDANLDELIKLAEKSEPAIAREISFAIGKDWLANPNRILFGFSNSRRAALERLSQSYETEISQTALKYLSDSLEMDLGDRMQTFQTSFLKYYLMHIKYSAGLTN